MIILPLSLLAVIALAIMLEKAFIYWRYARLPLDLLRLAETYGFAWDELEKRLYGLHEQRLDRVIVLSARMEDNAGLEDFLLREFFTAEASPRGLASRKGIQ